MFKIIIAAVFITLFIGSYYVSRRTWRGLSAAFPKVKFGVVLLIFALMSAVAVLGFVRVPFPEGVRDALKLTSYCWIVFFLYLMIYTVISDIVLLVCKLCKCSYSERANFRCGSVFVVFALALITVVCGAVNAKQIDHVSYEIQLENKIDVSDMNIVLLSDLHLGSVGSEANLENIVQEINSLDPDVVCIAGDVFDSNFGAIKDPDKAMETLKNITSSYGVYACLGNHDAGQTVEQMIDFLEDCNIQTLNEEYALIDERLVLIGRLDSAPIGRYGDLSRKELSEFFVRTDNTLPVIVMDHNPANIDAYTNEVDLIMSGHTHKGQVFPGSVVTNLIYTVDYGHYRKDADSPHVIVTSGVGIWGPPIRIGSDSEIVSVKLK